MQILDKLSRTISESYTKYLIDYYDEEVIEKIFNEFKGSGWLGEVWLKTYIEILAKIRNGRGQENPLKKGEFIIGLPADKGKSMVVFFTKEKNRRNMIYDFKIEPCNKRMKK